MPCPDMTWVRFKIKREIGVFSIQRSQPPFPSSASPPPIATHHGNGGYEKQPIQIPPRPSWSGKISPAVLFIIVILAAVVFIGGLLHLLVKFLMKHRPFSGGGSQESNSNTNNNRMSGSDDAVQRQLQQLFHLHDSGLDQASIDALPVFVYKEIIGSLKEPFDCAVCLCEFSEMDKLRLLPFCSHAFHIDCIDTWLLSNSTCPLCRGSLYTSCFTIQNPIFDLEDPREEGFSMSSCSGETLPESSILNLNQRRVFSVRLGKLRSCSGFRIESRGETSGGGSGSNIMSCTTNRNLDPRRCYSSMGSYQYVVSELELQVPAAFCLSSSSSSRNVGGSMRSVRGGVDGDQGKRISIASKGESFSVSKIWLWPKKTKLPTSSETHNHNHNRGSNLRLT